MLKGILAVLVFIYALGNAFKELHLVGGDEMLLIALTAIALLMYFVGYFLSRIRWLGVVSGVALAIGTMGILLKTLHLNGADAMLRTGIILLAILIPALIWKRKSFHGLFLRMMRRGFANDEEGFDEFNEKAKCGL